MKKNPIVVIDDTTKEIIGFNKDAQEAANNAGLEYTPKMHGHSYRITPI